MGRLESCSNASITTWEEMENVFIHKWSERRDYGYILIEFNAMNKTHNEDVSKFIKRFNKIYNGFTAKIKSPQVVSKVVFLGDFESEFDFTLREIKSHTLDLIHSYSLEVEANFTSTGKSRGKPNYVDRRRGKEKVISLGQGRENQE